MKKITTIAFLLSCLALTAQTYKQVKVTSQITKVQPMTGIVLHGPNYDDTNKIEEAQLEFVYIKYSDVVSKKDKYDWTIVNASLDRIANRGHQAVVRLRFVLPKTNGGVSAVPQYIKDLPAYKEEFFESGDGPCYYADWSCKELENFTLKFYTEFTKVYDNDPRIAFVQTGFGHWAEFHISGGPELRLGGNFPSKTFQSKFFNHLASVFINTPWSISIDAAGTKYTDFKGNATLRNLNFGVFDDTFLSPVHDKYNVPKWDIFGRDRYKTSPAGGEIAFYPESQAEGLSEIGVGGKTFDRWAQDFHITYMFGAPQLNIWKDKAKEVLLKAGLATGYRFKLEEFLVADSNSKVTFTNKGVAPIYHDAYVAVNGIRSTESLKGLLPGDRKMFTVASGGNNPILTIECDRLLPEQAIQFDGNDDVITSIEDSKVVGIRVYPNPAQNFITIEGVESGIAQILDVNGIIIREFKFVEEQAIDISNMSSGVYFVKIGSEAFRIIKS